MRRAARAIVFVVGSTLAVAPLLPGESGSLIEERAAVWFDILAAFAFLLGGASLFKAHATKIEERSPGWRYSAVTVVAFSMTLAAGLFKLGAPSWETGVCEPETWLRLIYDAVYAPVQATIISLLAFYVTSALVRTARAARGGAALMLGAAAVTLVGPAPLSRWVLSGPNLGGQRALIIGIAAGVVVFSVRVILGLERPLERPVERRGADAAR